MRKKINIIKVASLFFLVLGMAIATQSLAITGPSAGAGVGSGLINVEPTGTGNLSVGEIAADTSTKFQITGTTANSSAFGLKVWPSSGSVNFQVRNDGVVSIASTTYVSGGICFGAIGATDCISSWSGVGGGVTSTPAGYITPGYFNSIAGTGGNYSFPASLSIGTSTAPSGGVLFVNGNVGIGTKAPATLLQVSNKSGGTIERVAYFTNENISGVGEVKSLFIGIGNGSAYSTGYGQLGMIMGNGSVQNALQFSNNAITFKQPTFIANNVPLNSSSIDIGASVQMFKMNTSNNLEVGPKYSNTSNYGVDFYISGTGGSYKFYNQSSSPTALVTILGTGNVGIATTTPGSPLTVAGAIYSSTGGFKFPDGTTQTTAAGSGTNYWALSGTDLYPTSTAYQVGIGTTEPHYPLEVFGTSNKLGITYSYSAVGGDSTGGELYADSNGDLHINAKKTTTLIQNRNILMSEAGGNVGIGTTTPGSPLTVVGAIYSSTGGFKFPDGTTQTTAATGGSGTNYFTLSGSSLYPTSTAYNAGFGTASLDANYKITTAGGGIKAESTSQPAGYFNSSSGYGLIVNTGFVGVGTTAPAYPLDVVGDSFATGTMRTSQGIRFGTNGLSAAPVLFAYNAAGFTSPNPAGRGLGFYSYSNTAGDIGIGFSGENITAASGDNINAIFSRSFLPTSGTGTFSLLKLAGSINQSGGANGITRGLYINPTLTSAADWRSIDMGNNSGYGIYQSGASAKNYFAGNVGVATTTPGSPLTVAGAIYSSTGGFKFPDGTTQTTAATSGGGGYGWTTSGTSVILATSTNNVGIGQTPTYKLDVSGVIRGQGTAFSGDVLLVGNDAKVVDIDVANTLGIYSQTTPTEGGILLGSSGPTIYGKTGNVGIATTTPGYPLTVSGTSMFTGTMTIGSAGDGKLNVGTVDPPYTINGAQYATYMPGMTGQKEETTGEVNIECQTSNTKCEYVIDFAKVEKGSDLWLFSKTTNLKSQMGKMSVLLTPAFDGKIWYEKDVANLKLTIFASPSPSTTYNLQPTTYSVSYRLTAPRFDSEKWQNTRNDPGVSGFVISD